MTTKLQKAAFALETVAHLQRLEWALLPLAEHLRTIHKVQSEMGYRPSEAEMVQLMILLRADDPAGENFAND